jgi:hypothetical protein
MSIESIEAHEMCWAHMFKYVLASILGIILDQTSYLRQEHVKSSLASHWKPQRNMNMFISPSSPWVLPHPHPVHVRHTEASPPLHGSGEWSTDATGGTPRGSIQPKPLSEGGVGDEDRWMFTLVKTKLNTYEAKNMRIKNMLFFYLQYFPI